MNFTVKTIKIHWPTPKNNPVVNRKKLLLTLHCHFCVKPSINKGRIKIGMNNIFKNEEKTNKSGKNK
jgi:hypothetical protein